MISPLQLYEIFKRCGLHFYAGVPDSLLKDFCAFVADQLPPHQNIICANEGAAVAAVAGHYLATAEAGVVYLQNSGLGNAVNPLLSLADPDVYGIPLMLVIGWRGEPGVKDEPQHIKQGTLTLPLLQTMGIPHAVVDKNHQDCSPVVADLCHEMTKRCCPVALVVPSGCFESYESRQVTKVDFEMNREDALKIIIAQLSERDIVVSTTGMTSREIFEYRAAMQMDHSQDFLTIGSMGHASQIALGIALTKMDRTVYCIDGDGAAIMHMGSFATTASLAPSNFKHIIINNGAHDSVGGQPTAGFFIDFCEIARGCRYRSVFRVETFSDLHSTLGLFKTCAGPALLEVRVRKGFRKNLGRPTTSPRDNKRSFMRFLE